MITKPCITIKKMTANFEKEYAAKLCELFKQYNIFITIDGKFVDCETKQLLRDNHVKCMLRRDYIESGHGQISGSVLVNIVERFMIGLKRAAAALSASGETDFTGEMEIKEEYL